MKQLLIISSLLACIALNGQDWLQPQMNHKISGKAARGGLYDLTIDEDASEVRMTYMTKDRKKKAEFEQYVYDLNTLEEKRVDDFEEERGSSSRGFIFASTKDVEYTYSPYFLTVRNNVMGTMVVERGYYSAATESLSTINIGGKQSESDKGLFNRKNLGVINQYVSYQDEDKEKFKDEDDRRFTLIASRNMASDAQLRQSAIDESAAFDGMGDIMLVGMPNKIIKLDKELVPHTRYHFMKISAENFEVTKDIPYDFEKMHVATSTVKHSNGDLSIIFRPVPKLSGQGAAGLTEHVKENLKEYTLLRVNRDAEVVSDVTFEMPLGDINLISSEAEDGGVIISGFFNPDKNTHANLAATDPNLVVIDRKDIVMTKLTANGDQQFLTIVKGADLINNSATATNEKIKLPKASKSDKYLNRQTTIGGLTEVKGHYFFHFYSEKEELHHLVAFNNEGAFAKGFVAELVDVVDYFEITALNSENAVYWSIVQHDTKKIQKQTIAMPPTLRLGKLNLDEMSMGQMASVGDGKYYVNNHYVNAVPSKNSLLLFLYDGKKKIHLSLVKM